MSSLPPFEVATPVLLARDRHASPADGVCAMELTSLLAGERFSDHPVSVCPVISSYVRTLNDNMSDAERSSLLPLLPRIVGTKAPEKELGRERVLSVASARVFAADALGANGFRHYAAYLRRVEDGNPPLEGVSRIYRHLLSSDERTEPRSRTGLAMVSTYEAWRGLLVAFRKPSPNLDLVPDQDCGIWAGFAATNAHAAGAVDIWPKALALLEQLIDLSSER